MTAKTHTNPYPETHVSFNINDTILVKLTEKGYWHLADNHNKYCGIIRDWANRGAQYYKDKADEHGYTEMQAWKFFQEFGHVTELGFHGYYETTILIHKKHLNK